MANKGRASGPPGFVRIIGGSLRGRRLPVPVVPDLRPSPDRVRVTLFNWLARLLPGARCLDLFAGTGALGVEALSRGAARAVFVERSAVAAQALRQQCVLLGVTGAEIFTLEVQKFLGRTPEPFDVVFLDPPFQQQQGPAILAALATGWVSPGGHVYWESAAHDPTDCGPGWELIRDKTVAGVRSRLLRWDACPS